MQKKVVPMFHVTDVQRTIDWYRDIGFEVMRSSPERTSRPGDLRAITSRVDEMLSPPRGVAAIEHDDTFLLSVHRHVLDRTMVGAARRRRPVAVDEGEGDPPSIR